MLTLNIPAKRDPFARGALLALVGAVALWGIYGSATRPEQASAQASGPIIILEPTPALPTPAPTSQPALIAAPTAAPGWLDAALGSVAAAGDQMAQEQADLLAQEQAAAEAQAAADREQYLANIGAQAPHSPRGDVQAPPAYQPGPVDVGGGVVLDPNPAPAPVDQVAVMAPAISPAQAEVIGARESNSCAAGEIFYPRTGCHAPGSGGPQSGPVSR